MAVSIALAAIGYWLLVVWWVGRVADAIGCDTSRGGAARLPCSGCHTADVCQRLRRCRRATAPFADESRTGRR